MDRLSITDTSLFPCGQAEVEDLNPPPRRVTALLRTQAAKRAAVVQDALLAMPALMHR
jgi:hypothetical protein